MERQSKRGSKACASRRRRIGYFLVAERLTQVCFSRRGDVLGFFFSLLPHWTFIFILLSRSFSPSFFLLPLLLFICISSSVWMQCTKCPECRKTYNLCGGPRHEMMFYLVFFFLFFSGFCILSRVIKKPRCSNFAAQLRSLYIRCRYFSGIRVGGGCSFCFAEPWNASEPKWEYGRRLCFPFSVTVMTRQSRNRRRTSNFLGRNSFSLFFFFCPPHSYTFSDWFI